METLCSICLDKDKSIAFIPCGHVTCCTDCAYHVNTCPLCRKGIQNRIKIYLWPAWIFAYCLSTLVKKNGQGLMTMMTSHFELSFPSKWSILGHNFIVKGLIWLWRRRQGYIFSIFLPFWPNWSIFQTRWQDFGQIWPSFKAKVPVIILVISPISKDIILNNFPLVRILFWPSISRDKDMF